jgi:hypothetical protein
MIASYRRPNNGSNPMRRSHFYHWLAGLALAIALAPSPATAQETDTLSISGSFHIDEITGIVGDDLAGVSVADNGRWWTLTAYGVTYSHDSAYSEWYDDYGSYHYEQQVITRVRATSFDIEFFGPDANVLNAVVSQQLTSGSLTDGALLDLRNVYRYDEYPYWYYYYYYSYGYPQWYSTWELGLQPDDPATGVSFSGWNGYLGSGYAYAFPTDAEGYPVVGPQRITSQQLVVTDNRPDSTGALASYWDVVDFDSAEPPLPPTLNILDGSVLEGKKGTVSLDLTVTLSRSSNNSVTVHYATANGTAQAKTDYNSASGTLTIPSGQVQATIPVSIKGDRRREADETFTVQLSNAVEATINDGVGTVTILNDD